MGVLASGAYSHEVSTSVTSFLAFARCLQLCPPPWAAGPSEFLVSLNRSLPQGLSESELNGDIPEGVATDAFLNGGFKVLGLAMSVFPLNRGRHAEVGCWHTIDCLESTERGLRYLTHVVSMSKAALGAIVLTAKTSKSGNIDPTLGERAVQSLILGAFLHPDLRRWMGTIVSVELSRRGLTDESVTSIGRTLDLTTMCDIDAAERQIEVKARHPELCHDSLPCGFRTRPSRAPREQRTIQSAPQGEP